MIGAQACFWSEGLQDASELEDEHVAGLLAMPRFMWRIEEGHPEFSSVRGSDRRLADECGCSRTAFERTSPRVSRCSSTAAVRCDTRRIHLRVRLYKRQRLVCALERCFLKDAQWRL